MNLINLYSTFIKILETKELISDQTILDYINTLSKSDIHYYSVEYKIQDLVHYMTLQREWLNTSQYLTGINLNRKPGELEILNDWEKHSNSERFRVFYILKHPHKISELRNNIQKEIKNLENKNKNPEFAITA
jgi:hypothetical protein